MFVYIILIIIILLSRVKKLNIQNLAGFKTFRMMAVRRVLCGNDCTVEEGVTLDGCVGYKRLKDALQVHFKYHDFRPGQLEALLPVVHGRDVFVRLPTGGGKSLCIFLAPLAISDRAICIVVSPLISLMDQQVSFLLEFITCCVVHGKKCIK